jgi:hypothetical protein
MMSYTFNNKGSGNFSGFMSKVKDTFSPPPEAPEAPEPGVDEEPEEYEPEMVVPDDPSDYIQDPNCPEGQRMDEGECGDDPIYIELMTRLSDELKDLEERERKAAARAKIAEEQERIRQEMEANRLRLDEERRLKKIREEEQIRMLAVYGISAVGILTVITIIIKVALR